jgi:hypothetical protein
MTRFQNPLERVLPAIALVALLYLQAAQAQTPSASNVHCHVGTYRLADGRDIDIAPSDENLRWRLKDGTTGALNPAP